MNAIKRKVSILKIGGTVGASTDVDMVTFLTSMVLLQVSMGILEKMMAMVMIMVMVLIVMIINNIMMIKLTLLIFEHHTG